jgi:hypothetical protein
MANSQVPWAVAALNATITEPAWKTKPSWYLIATDDKMIPPPTQHFMSKRAGSTVVALGAHRELQAGWAAEWHRRQPAERRITV